MTKHLNYDPARPYKERNVEKTQMELIIGVGNVLREKGFVKLGISEVARRTGYDKKLIYHYFGNFEKLKTEYIKSKNVWDKIFTFEMPEQPRKCDLIDYLKSCYQNLLETLQEDLEIRNLFIWQLNEQHTELNKLTDGWNKQIDRILSLAKPYSELEMRAILAVLYNGVCGAVLSYEAGLSFGKKEDDPVTNYKDLIQTTHLLIEDIVSKQIGIA